MARSTAFSNSRTLPGHWYCCSTIHGRRRHPRDALVHLLCELLDEVVHQQRNVFAAFAQRRQLDTKHVEPIEKIWAEVTVFDQRLQVFVRRGDTAEIHIDLLVAADAHDLALLQNAQQVGLRLQADVADLVEEYRSAVGNLELALLAILRARERAFFVAEQFALQQRLRQRAAVDRHHRMETPRAGGMDGARHHFLAGAALAGDEHGGVGRARPSRSLR